MTIFNKIAMTSMATCLVFIFLFNQPATAEISYTANENVKLYFEKFSYYDSEGFFRASIPLPKEGTFTPNSPYIHLRISGLENYKEKKISFQITIKKTKQSLSLIEGILELEFIIFANDSSEKLSPFILRKDDIDGSAIQIEQETISIDYVKLSKKNFKNPSNVKVGDSEKVNDIIHKSDGTVELQNFTPRITIRNYDMAVAFLKNGWIACYNSEAQVCKILGMTEIKDSQLPAPNETKKIEFMNTILEGKLFEIKENSITIEMKNQSFLPVDKTAPLTTLFNVFYKFYYKKSLLLIKSGILQAGEPSISVTYPVCDDVYLRLEKHGYVPWDEEISRHNPDPQFSKIYMSQKSSEVVFTIRNGSGARVMIGENVMQVGSNEKVSFNINPDVEGKYYICKDGFEPIVGIISNEQKYLHILQQLKLKPPDLNKISFQNAHGYRGKITLKDDLDKTYTVNINQSNSEFKIFGARVPSNPIFVNAIIDKIKYIVTEKKQERNVFEIKPLWKEINISFKIKINDHGQEVPKKINVALRNVYSIDSDEKQDNLPLTFDNSNGSTTLVCMKSIYFPYFDPLINASIPNDRYFEGKNFTLNKNQTTAFDLNLDCRRPALGVVVFLCNSQDGINKQDVIDEKVRQLFRFQSDFKQMYIGWVDYEKTDFLLKDFEDNGQRQISISKRKTIDTPEIILTNIVTEIEAKFLNVNILNGEKIKPDILGIILDSRVPIDYSDYDKTKLHVKLIDLNKIEKNTVADLLKIIKSKED